VHPMLELRPRAVIAGFPRFLAGMSCLAVASAVVLACSTSTDGTSTLQGSAGTESTETPGEAAVGAGPSAPPSVAPSTPTSASASPACTETQTRCGDDCVYLMLNRENCGACGHACGPGEKCAIGECGPECIGGSIDCGDGNCAPLAVDPNNCGGCGIVCQQGFRCSGGGCRIDCAPGQVWCPALPDAGVIDPNPGPGGWGPEVCSWPSTDPNNCGACGVTCTALETCQAGVCVAGGTVPTDAGVAHD